MSTESIPHAADLDPLDEWSQPDELVDVAGKIWSCPRPGCTYRIADGPAFDEPTTDQLIAEHLAEHPDGPNSRLAHELRILADQIDAADLPALTPHLTFFSAGYNPRDEAVRTAWVDTVAGALLGTPGTPSPWGGGWYHAAEVTRGPLNVRVHGAIEDPTAKSKDAEIAMLKAQLDVARTIAADLVEAVAE